MLIILLLAREKARDKSALLSAIREPFQDACTLYNIASYPLRMCAQHANSHCYCHIVHKFYYDHGKGTTTTTTNPHCYCHIIHNILYVPPPATKHDNTRKLALHYIIMVCWSDSSLTVIYSGRLYQTERDTQYTSLNSEVRAQNAPIF